MRFLIIIIVLLLLVLGGLGFYLGGEEPVTSIEVAVEKPGSEDDE